MSANVQKKKYLQNMKKFPLKSSNPLMHAKGANIDPLVEFFNNIVKNVFH